MKREQGTQSLVNVLDISMVRSMAIKELSLDRYVETEAYPGLETKRLARSHVSQPLPWTCSLCQVTEDT